MCEPAVAGLEVPWLELLSVKPLGDEEARELLTASQADRLAPAVADRPGDHAALPWAAGLETPQRGVVPLLRLH